MASNPPCGACARNQSAGQRVARHVRRPSESWAAVPGTLDTHRSCAVLAVQGGDQS